MIVAEISFTLNAISGKQVGRKMDVANLIAVFDPITDAGQFTKTNTMQIENMHLVLSGDCQRSKIHLFFSAHARRRIIKS